MKKNVVKSIMVGALCAVMAIGGTLAYLTDGEKVTNTFTVGDVGIELLEPSYPGNDNDEVKDIVPNQEIEKDPQVKNVGVTDALVFLTVDSPIEDITLIKDDGSESTEQNLEGTTGKGLREIFLFKQSGDAASTHVNNFNTTEWVMLNDRCMYVKIAANGTETQIAAANLRSTYDALGDDDVLVRRYVFGHNEGTQGSSLTDGTLPSSGIVQTAPLFEKIQLKNFLENEIDECKESLEIRAYAIQSSELLENSIDLGDNLNSTNLGKIYDIFVRQNSTGDDSTGLKIEGLRNADSVASTSDGENGTMDTHVNRWNTTADVSTPNNVQP